MLCAMSHGQPANPSASLCLSELLLRLYVGPLQEALPPLAGVMPEGAIDALRFHDQTLLEELLEKYSANYDGGDLRGVASQWSKWHFNALLQPSLFAVLLAGQQLPLDKGLFVEVNPQGNSLRLCLQGDAQPLCDARVFFEQLVQEFLAPLVKALARVSGASVRVFWSNAGNIFENCISLAQQHPLVESTRVQQARAFLQEYSLANGRRNPLWQAVSYRQDEQGDSRRIRRLCCIRYLLPQLDYCGSCPLSEANRRCLGRT